jgi:hypothetical protein
MNTITLTRPPPPIGTGAAGFAQPGRELRRVLRRCARDGQEIHDRYRRYSRMSGPDLADIA